MNGEIHRIQVFTAQAILAGASATSAAIDLSAYKPSGFFSIQVAVSGDGTCKIEYLLSNDGTNYLEPTSASDIASGLLKTSGPGTDGKDIFSFTPEVAKHMKIKASETAGANAIAITANLVIQ